MASKMAAVKARAMICSSKPKLFLLSSKRFLSSCSFVAHRHSTYPPLAAAFNLPSSQRSLVFSPNSGIQLNPVPPKFKFKLGSNSSSLRRVSPKVLLEQDYNHWVVIMDKHWEYHPATEHKMIKFCTKVLAKVVSSEEAAGKMIYYVSCKTFLSFKCEIDKETSNKLRKLEGVICVFPDVYSKNVNYEDIREIQKQKQRREYLTRTAR